jgi:diguanylate cyclase (GGDEF)-like protein
MNDTVVLRARDRSVTATVDEAEFSSLLSEFAWRLATDFPIQAILDHLVERIVGLLPIDGAGVSLIAPDLAPRFVASSDPRALLFERLQTDLGQGPCVTTYLTGEPVVVADVATEKRFPAFTPAAHEAGMGAVFTFPLRQPGGRIGALDLYRNSPGLLNPRAMEVAQTLADVTSAYLVNAQKREEALATAERHRLLSLHDSLTGLPNRLLLQDRFRHATLRARRSHAGTAVLFIDIDGFKKVNDEHGHQTGDQVLIAVAQRLSDLIRAEDSLARIAGDEFVLLCEDVDQLADAELIRERVRESFDEPFSVDAGALPVSASVGLAHVGPDEPLSEDLIAAADRAMYRVKRSRASGPARG